MACMQLLKSSPSSCEVKLGRFSVRKATWLQNSGVIVYRRKFRVCCKVEDVDNQSNGKEPPESLFMKELKRRGMASGSVLEEKNRTTIDSNDETKFREEDGGWSFSSRRNGIRTDTEISLDGQRERSLALNSEGLEGLIPRGKLLLTLGATFFLAFWPLILATVASFSAVYLYFGPQFVHDGSVAPVSTPQYIDPYDLLKEDRIYKTAPRLN